MSIKTRLDRLEQSTVGDIRALTDHELYREAERRRLCQRPITAYLDDEIRADLIKSGLDPEAVMFKGTQYEKN